MPLARWEGTWPAALPIPKEMVIVGARAGRSPLSRHEKAEDESLLLSWAKYLIIYSVHTRREPGEDVLSL